MTAAAALLLALQPLRFAVDVSPALLHGPRDGRLLVVMAREAEVEPRLRIGETGFAAPMVVARDVRLDTTKPAVLDDAAVAFPLPSLRELPAGDYFVQALFDSNVDVRSLNAPGNLYSEVRRVRLDPSAGGPLP